MRPLLAAIVLLSLMAFAKAEDALSVIAEPVVYLVLFDSNDAELSNTARAVLDETAREYRLRKQGEDQSVAIWITGHYDTSGSSDYADRMSRKMAENVRDYLVAAGVPAGALEVSWSGERQPAVPTRDGVSEPANRRVEVNFSLPPM